MTNSVPQPTNDNPSNWEEATDLALSDSVDVVVSITLRGESLRALKTAAQTEGVDLDEFLRRAASERAHSGASPYGRHLIREDASSVPGTAALEEALVRYEAELFASGKTENTVHTYVDRARRFINWLNGSYAP